MEKRGTPTGLEDFLFFFLLSSRPRVRSVQKKRKRKVFNKVKNRKTFTKKKRKKVYSPQNDVKVGTKSPNAEYPISADYVNYSGLNTQSMENSAKWK